MAELRASRFLSVALAVCACSTPAAPAPVADAAAEVAFQGVDAGATAQDTAPDAATAGAADTGQDVSALADSTGPADAVLDAAAVVDAVADAAPEIPADVAMGADVAKGADAVADAVTDSDAGTAQDAASDSIVQADAAVDAAPDAAADAPGDAAADVQVDAAADVVMSQPGLGCADGTREAFLDVLKYPAAAACAGAWDIPGIHAGVPACGRKAGNDGQNAPGKGCNVEDLCAEGWHVCFGAADLKDRNPLGCGGIMDGGAKGPAFYLARTSSTGAFNCSQDSTKFGGPGTSNDLFGCGDLGCGISFTQYPSCDPLHKASHDLCKGLRNDLGCGDWCAHLGKFPGQQNTWDCGKDTVNEANKVVKSDPTTQGGVLCCADTLKAP